MSRRTAAAGIGVIETSPPYAKTSCGAKPTAQVGYISYTDLTQGIRHRGDHTEVTSHAAVSFTVRGLGGFRTNRDWQTARDLNWRAGRRQFTQYALVLSD